MLPQAELLTHLRHSIIRRAAIFLIRQINLQFNSSFLRKMSGGPLDGQSQPSLEDFDPKERRKMARKDRKRYFTSTVIEAQSF